MTKERKLWEEALAIIDDNLQIVEGDIIGNRFATASKIVDFAQTQVKKLTIPRVSQQSEQLKAFEELQQMAWENAVDESDYNKILKIKEAFNCG